MTNDKGFDLNSIDFDDWDDAKETAAIEQIAKNVKPRHIIGGDMFIVEFADKKRIVLPLRISLDDVEAISSTTNDGIEQIRILLDRIGDKETTRIISAEPIAAMTSVAIDYFAAIEKISGATMGK